MATDDEQAVEFGGSSLRVLPPGSSAYELRGGIEEGKGWPRIEGKLVQESRTGIRGRQLAARRRPRRHLAVHPEQVAVIDLLMDGASPPEVADDLQIPRVVVRIRLSAAHEQLRAAFVAQMTARTARRNSGPSPAGAIRKRAPWRPPPRRSAKKRTWPTCHRGSRRFSASPAAGTSQPRSPAYGPSAPTPSASTSSTPASASARPPEPPSTAWTRPDEVEHQGKPRGLAQGSAVLLPDPGPKPRRQQRPAAVQAPLFARGSRAARVSAECRSWCSGQSSRTTPRCTAT